MASPQDWPDWSSQVAGGLRYVGTFPNAGGTFTIPILTFERAIIIIPPGDTNAGQISTVAAGGHTTGAVVLNARLAGNAIGIAYVNAFSDTSWDITLSPSPGTAGAWFVFADTAPQVFDLPRIGPQLAGRSYPIAPPTDGALGLVGPHIAAQSLPVVVAVDGGAIPFTTTQLPAALVGGRLDTNLGAWLGSTLPTVGQKHLTDGIPVTPPDDLPIGTKGSKVSASSLPVVIASDQSTVPVSSTQLPAALVGGRLDENLGAWLGSTAPTVGQKVSASSVPVVVASDQSSLPTTEARLPSALVGGRLDDNLGSWMGSTAPTVGVKASAASLPVVLPTDAPGYRGKYDSMLFHVPAAATKATVTFAATVNRRWVLDYATWVLYSTAAAATQQAATVFDGATQVFASTLVIPATASVVDRLVLGPGAAIAGSLGNALTVEFTVAGPANTVERVSAGAYLLPAGV